METDTYILYPLRSGRLKGNGSVAKLVMSWILEASEEEGGKRSEEELDHVMGNKHFNLLNLH